MGPDMGYNVQGYYVVGPILKSIDFDLDWIPIWTYNLMTSSYHRFTIKPKNGNFLDRVQTLQSPCLRSSKVSLQFRN